MGKILDLLFGEGFSDDGVHGLSSWENRMIDNHKRDTGCPATYGTGAPFYRCGDCGKPLSPLF